MHRSGFFFSEFLVECFLPCLQGFNIGCLGIPESIQLVREAADLPCELEPCIETLPRLVVAAVQPFRCAVAVVGDDETGSLVCVVH